MASLTRSTSLRERFDESLTAHRIEILALLSRYLLNYFFIYFFKNCTYLVRLALSLSS